MKRLTFEVYTVAISLVDGVLQICSRNHVKSELDYVKDILFCNGYPINLIENIIDRRLKSLGQENREPVPLDSVTLTIEKKLSLHYHTSQNSATNSEKFKINII